MKNRTSLFVIVSTLISLHIKRMTNFIQLATLEAKLTGKTLIRMTILLYVMGFFVLSTWASLLLILFIYLVSLQFSELFAAFIIMLLNLAGLFIIVFSLLRMKQDLLFPATRRQIANVSGLTKKKD
jgi:hypothetical protein